MEKKYMPCFCTIILGIITIVFAWINTSWAPIIVTIAGALVIIRGFINKCCCSGQRDQSLGS